MIDVGPLWWMNWQALEAGAPANEGIEVTLFSDSHLIGLGDYRSAGPCRFINAMGRIVEGRLSAGIVVEVDLHEGDYPEMQPPPLLPSRAASSSMRTLRTWRVLRQPGRRLSLIRVLRGWT